MVDKRTVNVVGQCIGCGECIRVCDAGAISAAASGTGTFGRDHVAIALVSPVLYAQFPGVMPKDILMGLRRWGFDTPSICRIFWKYFITPLKNL